MDADEDWGNEPTLNLIPNWHGSEVDPKDVTVQVDKVAIH